MIDILNNLRPGIHLALHFLIPLAVALIWFRDRWKWALFIMLATMIIDLDHLLAQPIYDPGRCGINFHPLHTWWALGAYAVLTIIPKTRLIGLGLLIHLALDGSDCLWIKAAGI